MLATVAIAPAAWSSTPLPAKPSGNGTEPTAGGGTMAGKPFAPHAALAVFDISFKDIQIYLLTKPAQCSDLFFVNPPYIKVNVDTGGKPLAAGGTISGDGSVQVDFHPPGPKYYGIQPSASVTFTRIDPNANGVWHGHLVVKRQQFEGKTFAYDGTFAARWCGHD